MLITVETTAKHLYELLSSSQRDTLIQSQNGRSELQLTLQHLGTNGDVYVAYNGVDDPGVATTGSLRGTKMPASDTRILQLSVANLKHLWLVATATITQFTVT